MRSVLVVPCFNEAARLPVDEFREMVAVESGVSLVFVDDGSTDTTREVLTALADRDGISLVALDRNMGKAEAVRRGLIVAASSGADWVGYVDADLATPRSEIARLLHIAESSPDHDCVFGSRVRLCGNQVTRKLSRHVSGRVFAGLADRVLGAHVYDTQAGAKFFRVSDRFTRCLAQPFADRWAFDVELLGRLGRVGVFPDRTIEVPLRTWIDREGSKVSLVAGVRSVLSLWRIKRRLDRFVPT